MSRAGGVLVDASNLRVGGGVQVAASFLDELVLIYKDPYARDRYPWLETLSVEVSAEVRANMRFPRDIRNEKVLSRKWSTFRSWRPVRRADRYALSFVVFGPEYGARRSDVRVVGFADGTALLPAACLPGPAGRRRRLFHAVRSAVSRHLFEQADHVVVEADHVGRNLALQTRISPEAISVVPNAVNDIFYDAGQHTDSPEELARIPEDCYVLCYVARAYPHKNHDLLGAVWKYIQAAGSDVRFIVTLTENEWQSCSSATKSACINVGPMTLNKLPALYRASDGAIFPSLLESSSVTPLEALIANGLLFASDRHFVRDTCGEAPIYFDPRSPRECANTILHAMTNPSLVATHRARAAVVAASLPTAHGRASEYVSLIDTLLEGSSQ